MTKHLYPLCVHNIDALLSLVNHTMYRAIGRLGTTPTVRLLKPTRSGEDLACLKQDENKRMLAARRVQEEKH